ncbi:META domain-containing protein [Gillisia sp. Hel_I_86]|uniref:META domain-containing protein n=1 Tax=Gillisia sp. Hel_I_86 TaxID=1249981 RepID=UPI0011990635|nr:META domain-containing protein [Gillisia sp. Hel_I_86]TVZ25236.1 META domain-containing protein [Gillisia sp. Hel_I_86]
MNLAKLTFVFFVGLFAPFIVSSCNNNDDAMSPTNQVVDVDQETIDEVKTNVQSGTWRITKFMEDDVDETDRFTGFSLIFDANGTLTASDGTETFMGTWSITDSDSSDDDSNDDDLDFNINFNLTNDFEDLNDDWNFVSRSATKVELTDISDGNGGIDFLTFEKN